MAITINEIATGGVEGAGIGVAGAGLLVPGPTGPTGSPLLVTDGSNVVTDVANLTITGGVVSGTTPNATITISGGGGVADEVHVLDFLNYLPQASFTGSISGTTLTVTGTPTGIIVPGQTISGGTISAGTVIYGYVSGSGGAGTYTVNNTQSVVSTSITTQTGDYTPVYQAAIDYAFANNIYVVRALPYAVQIYSSIFLDPPGSLRTNLSNPPALAFTMELLGGGPSPGQGGGGSIIDATFDNAPVLWMGPGNQLKVSRITCFGQVNVAHPKLHNAANTAIAIAGGSNGATKTRIDDCYIYNFYTAVSVGQNAQALAEVNTLINVQCLNCYYGYWVASTNECVNELINCAWCATWNVYSPFSAVRSIGGEFNSISPGSPSPCQTATVSAVSALTKVSGSYNAAVYTFTATISSPSALWAHDVFNACAVYLSHFGLVPCTPINFNAGTSVVTLQLTGAFVSTYCQTIADLSSLTATDFNTELQAVTTLYAVELTTLFYGVNQVRDWRVEAATSMCFMNVAAGGFGQSILEGGYNNGDITLNSNYAGNSSANSYSHFVIQQCFGFLAQNAQADLLVQDNNWSTDGTGYPGYKDSVCIDLYQFPGQVTPQTVRFIYRNNSPLYNPNIRGPGFVQDLIHSDPGYGLAAGDQGEFDQPMFVGRWGMIGAGGSFNEALYNNLLLRSQGSKGTTYKGFLPQGGIQRITAEDVAALTGVVDLTHPQSLPLTTQGDSKNVQQLQDHHVAVVSQRDYQNYALTKRNGKMYSYGAALAVTGNYKAQSWVVNTTGGANLGWIFPGLEVVIQDQTTATNYSYVITGVYPSFNYFTVACIDPALDHFNLMLLMPNSPSPFTAVYTITTLGQSPIVMQKFGRQCEFVNSALSELAGNTYAQGDLVWIVNAAASSSPGWVCTTAGIVGSGASFSPMAVLGAAVTP